jgi:hypothetical protein
VDSTPSSNTKNSAQNQQISSFSTSFDSGKATPFEAAPLSKFQAIPLANGLSSSTVEFFNHVHDEQQQNIPSREKEKIVVPAVPVHLETLNEK